MLQIVIHFCNSGWFPTLWAIVDFAMAKRSDRPLSNLEMTVLGFAWLRGPCTVYSVMKELSHSESTYHKSRAGAAYSVAKRLIGFGLLEPVDDGMVRISESGVAALQEWLSPPMPQSDIAHSADLIRLRFFFLGAVAPEVRLAFIDQALRGLEEFLGRCRGLLRENEEIGDYFGVLATVSSVYETEARIRWLQLVRAYVVDPSALDRPWSETMLGKMD